MTFVFNEFIISYIALLLTAIYIAYFISRYRKRDLFVLSWPQAMIYGLVVYAFVSILFVGYAEIGNRVYLHSQLFIISYIQFIVLRMIYRFPEMKVPTFYRKEYERIAGFFVLGIGLSFSVLGLTLFFNPPRFLTLIVEIWVVIHTGFLLLATIRRARYIEQDKWISEWVGIITPEQVRKGLRRLSFFFAIIILADSLVAARYFVPLFETHLLLQRSYGTLVLIVLFTLIDLNIYSGKDLLLERITLIVLLGLFLSIALATFVQTRSLVATNSTLDPASLIQLIDQAMRPIAAIQILLAIGFVFGIPILIRLTLPSILAEEPEPLLSFPDISQFTGRQLEVLPLLAKNMSNKEIAASLHITEDTVKYHISNMLRKQSFRNRHELADYARDQIRQGRLESETADSS